MGQTLILSEHEDEMQNRYEEKHASQTDLRGALIFDDDLPLKAALITEPGSNFLKIF